MIQRTGTGRMRPLLLGVAGAGLIAFAAACSSSSGSGKPAVTPHVSPMDAQAFKAAANTAADLVLLKSTDLPAGWSGSPHAPAPLTGFTGQCEPLNPDDPISGSSLSKSSDDFVAQGGDDAMSQADVFTSADAASASFTSLMNVIAHCHDQFVSVFKALYTESGAAFVGINDPRALVTDVQVSFNALRGAAYDDASSSYRLSFGFSVGNLRVGGQTDIVFIRSGALVADVIHTTFSGDTALTDGLAKAVADRMVAANRQLPQ